VKDLPIAPHTIIHVHVFLVCSFLKPTPIASFKYLFPEGALSYSIFMFLESRDVLSFSPASDVFILHPVVLAFDIPQELVHLMRIYRIFALSSIKNSAQN